VISRLILVQPDTPLRESLRFGFEREGVAVVACAPADFEPALFAEPAELVITAGRDRDEARAVLSLVRGALAGAPGKPPVLYVGNGIPRAQALAEGATEVLGQPVFVRDAVTVARLLAGRKRDNPSVLTGDLGEHFGLFYLVRAVSALGRRGVLTLVRGMRRGELRFFDGEVTSAQVGLLHGLAALHQLLLWTEGRFELRPEDVVRRRQIPLEPAELFADAERFLSEICAVAGQLSPTARYERDARQIDRASTIPPEIGVILTLFDGSRTVADVVEDSQYRVFETLRIANRLCELGMIRLRTPADERERAAAAERPRSSHVVISKAGARLGPVPGGSAAASANWVGCPPPTAGRAGATARSANGTGPAASVPGPSTARAPGASGPPSPGAGRPSPAGSSAGSAARPSTAGAARGAAGAIGGVAGSSGAVGATGGAAGAIGGVSGSSGAAGGTRGAPAVTAPGARSGSTGSRRAERRRKRRRGRDQDRRGQDRREPDRRGQDRRGQAASQRAESATAGGLPLVVDWEQLLPDAAGADLVVSPVVPSAVAAGEISLADPDGSSPSRADSLPSVSASAAEAARLATEPLRASTEPLRSSTEPLRASTEPLRSSTEPLRASTEPLRASTEPLRSSTEPRPPPAEPRHLVAGRPPPAEPRHLVAEARPSTTEPRHLVAEARPSTVELRHSTGQPARASTESRRSTTEPRVPTEPLRASAEPRPSTTEPRVPTEPLGASAEPRPSTTEPRAPTESRRAPTEPRRAPTEPRRAPTEPRPAGDAGRPGSADGQRRLAMGSRPSFSASEEEFFARGTDLVEETESFEDLDQDHLPQSFWRRLFRSATRSSEPPANPRRRR
jgi:hypothetical protein